MLSEEKCFLSGKGGGIQWNSGLARIATGDGNSLNRSGSFSEPPDPEIWKVAVLTPFPKSALSNGTAKMNCQSVFSAHTHTLYFKFGSHCAGLEDLPTPSQQLHFLHQTGQLGGHGAEPPKRRRTIGAARETVDKFRRLLLRLCESVLKCVLAWLSLQSLAMQENLSLCKFWAVKDFWKSASEKFLTSWEGLKIFGHVSDRFPDPFSSFFQTTLRIELKVLRGQFRSADLPL